MCEPLPGPALCVLKSTAACCWQRPLPCQCNVTFRSQRLQDSHVLDKENEHILCDQVTLAYAGALLAFCQSCTYQRPAADLQGSSPAFTAASQAFQQLQLTSEQLRSICQLPWSLSASSGPTQVGAAEADGHLQQQQKQRQTKLAALQIQFLAATLAPDVCK